MAQTGFIRDRPREFNDPNPPSKQAALQRLDDAVAMVEETIRAQSARRLVRANTPAPGPNAKIRLDMIVQCAAHIEHHIGQMIYLTYQWNRQARGVTSVIPSLSLQSSVFPCVCVVKLSVQLKASLSSAIARLAADQVPSPRLNAELLLRFTLNCDRAYLFAHPERELTDEEQMLASNLLSPNAPAACQRNTSLDIRNSGAWT